MTNLTTPNLNFLVKSKSNAKPLSKTMMYFFKMLHIIFALDFGFIKSKSPRTGILLKLITFVHSSIVFIYLAFILLDQKHGTEFTDYSISYFIFLLVSYIFTLILVVSKSTFYDYQSDLHSFDNEIEVDSSIYKTEYKIIVWFIILIVYRTVMSLGYCEIWADDCAFPIALIILYNMSMVGLDTVLVVYTCIFYDAYLRLKRFVLFIEYDGKDVISCQYLYKNLVEIIERVKKPFDIMLVLVLVTNTVDVTITIYIPYAQDVLTIGALNMAVAYIIVVQELLMLFAPAFTAGLLSIQVKKLKLALYEKRLKDKAQATDLKLFAAYVHRRPLRFKVWRVVPLDWRLPVIVLNTAVTYLIVMIQFTQKK